MSCFSYYIFNFSGVNCCLWCQWYFAYLDNWFSHFYFLLLQNLPFCIYCKCSIFLISTFSETRISIWSIYFSLYYNPTSLITIDLSWTCGRINLPSVITETFLSKSLLLLFLFIYLLESDRHYIESLFNSWRLSFCSRYSFLLTL